MTETLQYYIIFIRTA